MTDKNDFFTQLKALYSKAPLEYDEKIMPSYLMLLWCSHDKDNFEYVERISKYVFSIKAKYVYKYLWYKLPVIRNKYLKWVKKEKLDATDELRIEELCAEYDISEYEAKKLL